MKMIESTIKTFSPLLRHNKLSMKFEMELPFVLS